MVYMILCSFLILDFSSGLWSGHSSSFANYLLVDNFLIDCYWCLSHDHGVSHALFSWNICACLNTFLNFNHLTLCDLHDIIWSLRLSLLALRLQNVLIFSNFFFATGDRFGVHAWLLGIFCASQNFSFLNFFFLLINCICFKEISNLFWS